MHGDANSAFPGHGLKRYFHVVVLEPAPMELTPPGCMKYRHVWDVPRMPAVEIKV